MTRALRPSISVIMPAFNPGIYGPIAVAQVLAALDEGDELVVQDNRSNDGWLGQLPNDSRLRIACEQDFGQADALNRALARAQNDWVLWVNADDVLSSAGLATLLAKAREVDSPIVYGDFATVDSEGSRIRGFAPGVVTLSSLVSRGCVVFNGSTLVRREFLVDIGGFASEYHYAMDYELWLRAWSRSASDPIYVPITVGSLRLHGETKTAQRPWRFVREARRVRRAYARGRRLRAAAQTSVHAITVVAGPMRQSRIYRRLRHRDQGAQS